MKTEKVCLSVALILSCCNILVAGYFLSTVAVYHQELSLVPLLVTVFINVATIFFTATLMFALIQRVTTLIVPWLIYSLIELMRSGISIQSCWKDSSEAEKLFNASDSLFQVLLIVIVLHLTIDGRIKPTNEISTISRSLSDVTIFKSSRA